MTFPRHASVIESPPNDRIVLQSNPALHFSSLEKFLNPTLESQTPPHIHAQLRFHAFDLFRNRVIDLMQLRELSLTCRRDLFVELLDQRRLALSPGRAPVVERSQQGTEIAD